MGVEDNEVWTENTCRHAIESYIPPGRTWWQCLAPCKVCLRLVLTDHHVVLIGLFRSDSPNYECTGGKRCSHQPRQGFERLRKAMCSLSDEMQCRKWRKNDGSGGPDSFSSLSLSKDDEPHNSKFKLQRIEWIGFFFITIIFPMDDAPKTQFATRNTERKEGTVENSKKYAIICISLAVVLYSVLFFFGERSRRNKDKVERKDHRVLCTPPNTSLFEVLPEYSDNEPLPK